MTEPSHSKMLAALSVAAVTHLADAAAVIGANGELKKCRMMRVGDIALVDLPSGDSGPRVINCYCVEVAIDGYKFKLDPLNLVYSLQWLHNGTPPGLHLSLVRDLPTQWVNAASLVLLGELRRRAPEAINWAAMADVVPVLDAFEAVQESRMARQH